MIVAFVTRCEQPAPKSQASRIGSPFLASRASTEATLAIARSKPTGAATLLAANVKIAIATTLEKYMLEVYQEWRLGKVVLKDSSRSPVAVGG